MRVQGLTRKGHAQAMALITIVLIVGGILAPLPAQAAPPPPKVYTKAYDTDGNPYVYVGKTMVCGGSSQTGWKVRSSYVGWNYLVKAHIIDQVSMEPEDVCSSKLVWKGLRKGFVTVEFSKMVETHKKLYVREEDVVR